MMRESAVSLCSLVFDYLRSASTRVVFPWSTWAIMATFLMAIIIKKARFYAEEGIVPEKGMRR